MVLFHWNCNALTVVTVASKENPSTAAANGLRRKSTVQEKSPLTKRMV